MARFRTRSTRMQCPKYGEVDIERCFSCFALRRLRARHGHVELWCTSEGRPFRVDDAALAALRRPSRI